MVKFNETCKWRAKLEEMSGSGLYLYRITARCFVWHGAGEVIRWKEMSYACVIGAGVLHIIKITKE